MSEPTRSALELTPDELASRYDGDVVRLDQTVDLPAERWESASARDDHARWGVGALVVHEGRLLLVRQDEQWWLPGGMLEPEETHAAGAAREVREETGVTVSVDGLAAISEQTFRHAETGTAFDFAFATFRATPERPGLADDPGTADEEIDAAAWRDAVPEDTFDRDLVERLYSDAGRA